MKIASVTSKGQIVIPSKLRKELNIGKGTKLYIEQRGREIIFRPMDENYFENMAGILKIKPKNKNSRRSKIK